MCSFVYKYIQDYFYSYLHMHSFVKAILAASIFIALFFFCSCSNNHNISGEVSSTPDSAVFFPIHDYFISQLKDADSSASFFTLQQNINGAKDSAYIDAGSLKKIAAIFLETDIEKNEIKKFYKETIFEDLTTASYTFSYKTTNEKLVTKNVDVLLDRGTQQVKWIFITRYRKSIDSSITEKLNWHSHKSFSVNRMIAFPGKPDYTEQVSVSWK